ncbi:MAG: thioredoxin family protein [Candidatus Cloacimonas sp.]|jgi:thioredoxin-related protein|nr:thioredoxin family protein [Candidatus Cloacimonas sp.]
MKWILIIALVASVAVLGCTPNSKPKAENAPETAEEVSFDDAMATYQGGTWLTDYDSALANAKELNRPILVNFTGSDWCSWCMKLADEVFTQKSFNDYAAKNLILLKIDFPSKIAQTAELKAANDKLAKKFSVMGYPTIVILDPSGTEINRTGYQPGGAEAYVKHLQELIAGSK